MAPDDSLGYTNLGATHAMAGQYDAAAENFKKSLALRQTASAYTSLGTIYYFLDRCAEAVPLMERASELAPKSEQMWGNLGDAYACAGGPQDAASSAYKRAVQLGLLRLGVNPDDGETLSVVALYQAKLGDKAKALGNIRRARRIAPASRKVLWESALVYELTGDRNEALAALTGAIHGGQPLDEVRGEPALAKLRADPRYQKLMASFPTK
jgi:serine/threonine-protein kinase